MGRVAKTGQSDTLCQKALDTEAIIALDTTQHVVTKTRKPRVPRRNMMLRMVRDEKKNE
jgi:hypothetical protein